MMQKKRAEDELNRTKKRLAEIDQEIENDMKSRAEDELKLTKMRLEAIDVLQDTKKHRAEFELNRNKRWRASYLDRQEGSQTQTEMDVLGTLVFTEVEKYRVESELRRVAFEAKYNKLKAGEVEAGDKDELNDKVQAGDKDMLKGKLEASGDSSDTVGNTQKFEADDTDKFEAGNTDNFEAGHKAYKDELNDKVEAGNKDMLKGKFEASDSSDTDDDDTQKFEADDTDKLEASKDKLKDKFESDDRSASGPSGPSDGHGLAESDDRSGRSASGRDPPLPPPARVPIKHKPRWMTPACFKLARGQCELTIEVN